ncbi:MAG: cobyrinate a,c-diamide synthase [Pseudomonadota bacterium]
MSAPSSGQGKTAVTLGLLRAFRRFGVDVASGKSGPDYIDPAFHRAATGKECVTLDGWAMDADSLRGRSVESSSALTIVEGAMGLFDGPVASKESGSPVPGSTAHLALRLGLPVVVVLDARRMGQSAGALIHGLSSWSPGLRVEAVILNQVASPRHEAMLRRSVEQTCPVLGVIPADPRLAMPSRHLGLVQASEMAELEAFLECAADVVSQHCDLDALLDLSMPLLPSGLVRRLPPLGHRVSVAQDVAFAFCYPHLLEDWRQQGAEISFFSPLADQAPAADCDAVYLPGGYPELHAHALANAVTFLDGLRTAAQKNKLLYGECGGYMVLGNALIDADGKSHTMAGLLSLETSFAERKRHLGYRRLEPLSGPWAAAPVGALAAHEFHYSTVVRAEGDALFRASDAGGVAIPEMGLVNGNVMGSFAHVIGPMTGH